MAPGVSSHRILVVDDDSENAESLSVLLRLSGHRAKAVYDGAAALRTANRLRPDIALIDLDLPDIDGVHIATRLRAQPWARCLKLIALSGGARDEDFQRAEEASFDAYLLKPVDLGSLHRLL